MAYMDDLICPHNMKTAASLTNELALAICWEEGQFRNGSQFSVGTALGFGQTEPAELQRLISAGAISIDMAKVRSFDDHEAIEAMLQMLDYYIGRFPNSRRQALKAYAGYDFKKTQAWHDNRNKIMDDWEACEAALMAINNYQVDGDLTMKALAKARPFNPEQVISGLRYRDWLNL